MMKRIFWLVAMLCVLCGAKATSGNDFNTANLPSLQINQTTLQDAIALLESQPTTSQVGVTGATVYTWSFVQAKASVWTGNSSVQQKSVSLVFNQDGTFQRIWRMQGVTLDPGSTKRLFTDPAALAAPKVQAATHPDASALSAPKLSQGAAAEDGKPSGWWEKHRQQ